MYPDRTPFLRQRDFEADTSLLRPVGYATPKVTPVTHRLVPTESVKRAVSELRRQLELKHEEELLRLRMERLAEELAQVTRREDVTRSFEVILESMRDRLTKAEERVFHLDKELTASRRVRGALEMSLEATQRRVAMAEAREAALEKRQGVAAAPLRTSFEGSPDSRALGESIGKSRGSGSEPGEVSGASSSQYLVYKAATGRHFLKALPRYPTLHTPANTSSIIGRDEI